MYKLYNVTTKSLLPFIHEGRNEHPMIIIPIDATGKVIGHAASGLVRQSEIIGQLINNTPKTNGGFCYGYDNVAKVTWVVCVISDKYVENKVLRSGRISLKNIVFVYANACAKILTSYKEQGHKQDPIIYIPHFDGVNIDRNNQRVYEQLLLLTEHFPIRVQCYYTHVAYMGNFSLDIELVEYKSYHYKGNDPFEIDDVLEPQAPPPITTNPSIALRYPYAKA